jgi:hypothetical protein
LPCIANHSRNLIRLVFSPEVVDGDISALLGQGERNRPTNPASACRSRYKGDLPHKSTAHIASSYGGITDIATSTTPITVAHPTIGTLPQDLAAKRVRVEIKQNIRWGLLRIYRHKSSESARESSLHATSLKGFTFVVIDHFRTPARENRNEFLTLRNETIRTS